MSTTKHLVQYLVAHPKLIGYTTPGKYGYHSPNIYHKIMESVSFGPPQNLRRNFIATLLSIKNYYAVRRLFNKPSINCCLAKYNLNNKLKISLSIRCRFCQHVSKFHDKHLLFAEKYLIRNFGKKICNLFQNNISYSNAEYFKKIQIE